MAKHYDPGADASLKQFKKSAATFRKLMRGNHDHHGDVRTDNYKGHKIEIKTTYLVKVDGKKIDLRFAPENDGSLLYHAVPNMRFASAVDLLRCLIDNFPTDFGKKSGPSPGGGGPHHGAPPRSRAKNSRKPAKEKRTAMRSGHAS